MRITVFGATGVTGRKVVEIALARGHQVVAVVRDSKGAPVDGRAIVHRGDVLDPRSLERALDSADAAISCIGPSNNLPRTLMSRGIGNIVAACESQRVQRFVFQSGILMTDGRELSLANRVAVRVLRWVLYASIRDKSIAERAVQQSRLGWVIVRPGGLANARLTPQARSRRSPPFGPCPLRTLLSASFEP